jgi:glucose/arabinose dehydrogenase
VTGRLALRAALALTLVVLGLVLVNGKGSGAFASPVPALDFTDALVAAVPQPSALAFTPDGRALVATRTGQLRVLPPNGTLLPTPALDLGGAVCFNYERGLLGVTAAPDFATSHHVFAYYTGRNGDGSGCGRNVDPYPLNRVSRFTLDDDNTIDPGSEVVVLDGIPSRSGQNNGGDLHFGADGLLYVSVGDGQCRLAAAESARCGADNNNARFGSTLLGKILRIAPDGSIPPGNPYIPVSGSRRCGQPGAGVAGGYGPCQETFAAGLRHPTRFAVRPGTSELYVNDRGLDTWEEIDRGRAGADYGWNNYEGHCWKGSTTSCGAPAGGQVRPMFDYLHSGGCSAISGGAFVPAGVWPAPYDGAYLFADAACGKIFRLDPGAGGGATMVDFLTGLGPGGSGEPGDTISLAFGPGGDDGPPALYYTTGANGGEVHRLTYTPGQRPPVAAFTVTDPPGPAPAEASFDAGASTDPEGAALVYRWDFGDAGPVVELTTPTTTHQYRADGRYTATLTVIDPDGHESPPVSHLVLAGVANDPPGPQVQAPTTTGRFTVGQAVTLRGTATDTEDGTLPDGALTWEVVLRRGTGTDGVPAGPDRPVLPPTAGNNVTFTAPAPESLAAAADSYLEIRLTATDSRGLSQTTMQRFDAKRATLTFASAPGGLKLVVGGTAITARTAFPSWVGYQIPVSAPSPQTLAGTKYRFSKWSDGKAGAHTITTPAQSTTYTATYTKV